MDYKHLKGDEQFTAGGCSLGFGVLDFWRFQYASLHNQKEYIAEFLIAKALKIDNPYNADEWTLFDILYRNTRIEVKQTSYYHNWNAEGKVSPRRTFGITKANSKYGENDNICERQNDIYVFCLNTGDSAEDSDPLKLENWEFYIVPTYVINENCGNNKTVSLGRVKKLAGFSTEYSDIKAVIDKMIDQKEKGLNK